MPELTERLENITRKAEKMKTGYSPGSVENVFLYNINSEKDESGEIAVFIKPDPVESKKKKSIN